MLKAALADLEDLHRAGLDTDTAGDALRGGRRTGNLQHHAERAGLHALAAANAELLIDHVHAGFRILGDRTVLTGRSTLAALDAGHRADLAVALNDLQAGLVLMELFIKCGRAGADALQTCHARNILLDEKFLHVSFPFGW